jgi:hypothetical protein
MKSEGHQLDVAYAVIRLPLNVFLDTCRFRRVLLSEMQVIHLLEGLRHVPRADSAMPYKTAFQQS